MIPTPLKILHIGNVANNAYNNAKILNAAGFDCDVLCNDHYQVMTCPEWEELLIEKPIRNMEYPYWSRAEIRGFKRPRWFVQGTKQLCFDYLTAKRCNEQRLADKLWARLERQRQLYGLLFQSRVLWMLAKVVYPKVKLFCARHSNKVKLSQPPRIVKEKILELNRLYKIQFPDDPGQIGEDISPYIELALSYSDLLRHYDIIHAYAVDCIYPFICGCNNYVAYEHGTIRYGGLLYQDCSLSRLYKLAYANAKSIIITNIDNVASAREISAHSDVKLVYGLHGVDVNSIIRKMELAQKSGFDGRFGASKDEKIFLCPSRHDKCESCGKELWLKGEDIILQAIELLKKSNYNFKVVFLEWGQAVDQLKIMIREKHLESCIIWHKPLSKPELLNAMSSADMVLDQFYLCAFGGIAIETLCSGKASLALAKFDENDYKLFFDTPFPAFHCENPADLFEAMSKVLRWPEANLLLAEEALCWVKKNHSNERILNSLIEAYK